MIKSQLRKPFFLSFWLLDELDNVTAEIFSKIPIYRITNLEKKVTLALLRMDIRGVRDR